MTCVAFSGALPSDWLARVAPRARRWSGECAAREDAVFPHQVSLVIVPVESERGAAFRRRQGHPGQQLLPWLLQHRHVEPPRHPLCGPGLPRRDFSKNRLGTSSGFLSPSLRFACFFVSSLRVVPRGIPTGPALRSQSEPDMS